MKWDVNDSRPTYRPKLWHLLLSAAIWGLIVLPLISKGCAAQGFFAGPYEDWTAQRGNVLAGAGYVVLMQTPPVRWAMGHNAGHAMVAPPGFWHLTLAGTVMGTAHDAIHHYHIKWLHKDQVTPPLPRARDMVGYFLGSAAGAGLVLLVRRIGR